MKNNNKSQRFQIFIFGILLLFILSGIFSTINPSKIEAQAETQNIEPFSNPLVLLEISEEIKIEFQTGIYVGAESDFQVGEKIMILLRGYLLRAGSFPSIAEKTYYVISNSTGDVIWSRDMGIIGKGMGEGWHSDPGGRWERGANWIPEKEGNYTAGIIFIQPFYENLQNNTNAVPFRVHKPGSVTGKVTESDQETPINDALVEAMLGNTIQSNTTTNSEGFYNLQIIPSGKYAIKVSKPGYKEYISEYIKTDFRIVNINFSLTILNVSSTIPDESTLLEPSPSPEPKNPIPLTIKTAAQIKLESKTSIVNQEVKVNMIIEPIPVTTEYFVGLVLTILDPVGHSSMHGPFLTNSNGTVNTFYTPKITGNYTFQLRYPGQIFNDKESEYTSSISSIVTLSVKGQLEMVEPSSSVQSQVNTTSTTIETISIQSSSDEKLLNSTVSLTPVNEPNFTQTLDSSQTVFPSTLEIVGIVLVMVFGIGVAINLVKKRRS